MTQLRLSWFFLLTGYIKLPSLVSKFLNHTWCLTCCNVSGFRNFLGGGIWRGEKTRGVNKVSYPSDQSGPFNSPINLRKGWDEHGYFHLLRGNWIKVRLFPTHIQTFINISSHPSQAGLPRRHPGSHWTIHHKRSHKNNKAKMSYILSKWLYFPLCRNALPSANWRSQHEVICWWFCSQC